MALTSYIKHRNGSRHIQIHSDTTEVVGGDHCASAFLQLLEHLSRGILDRSGMAPEEWPDDLWIEADMEKIHYWMVSLFGIRTIQPRIDWLAFHKLIYVHSPGIGKKCLYRIDVKLLNHLISNRISIGNFADEKNEIPIGNFAGRIADGDDMVLDKTRAGARININKEEIIEEGAAAKNTPPAAEEDAISDLASPPPAEEAELNLEDSVDKFARNVYTRERKIRLKMSIPHRDYLIAAEKDIGPVEFRSGLIAFLRTDSPWLRENGWPLNVYLKQATGGRPMNSFPKPQAPPKPSKAPYHHPARSDAATGRESGKNGISGRRPRKEIEAELGHRLEWWEDFWSKYPNHDDPLGSMDYYAKTIMGLPKAERVPMAKRISEAARLCRTRLEYDPSFKPKIARWWLKDEGWLEYEGVPTHQIRIEDPEDPKGYRYETRYGAER